MWHQKQRICRSMQGLWGTLDPNPRPQETKRETHRDIKGRRDYQDRTWSWPGVIALCLCLFVRWPTVPAVPADRSLVSRSVQSVYRQSAASDFVSRCHNEFDTCHAFAYHAEHTEWLDDTGAWIRATASSNASSRATHTFYASASLCPETSADLSREPMRHCHSMHFDRQRKQYTKDSTGPIAHRGQPPWEGGEATEATRGHHRAKPHCMARACHSRKPKDAASTSQLPTACTTTRRGASKSTGRLTESQTRDWPNVCQFAPRSQAADHDCHGDRPDPYEPMGSDASHLVSTCYEPSTYDRAHDQRTSRSSSASTSAATIPAADWTLWSTSTATVPGTSSTTAPEYKPSRWRTDATTTGPMASNTARASSDAAAGPTGSCCQEWQSARHTGEAREPTGTTTCRTHTGGARHATQGCSCRIYRLDWRTAGTTLPGTISSSNTSKHGDRGPFRMGPNHSAGQTTACCITGATPSTDQVHRCLTSGTTSFTRHRARGHIDHTARGLGQQVSWGMGHLRRADTITTATSSRQGSRTNTAAGPSRRPTNRHKRTKHTDRTWTAAWFYSGTGHLRPSYFDRQHARKGPPGCIDQPTEADGGSCTTSGLLYATNCRLSSSRIAQSRRIILGLTTRAAKPQDRQSPTRGCPWARTDFGLYPRLSHTGALRGILRKRSWVPCAHRSRHRGGRRSKAVKLEQQKPGLGLGLANQTSSQDSPFLLESPPKPTQFFDLRESDSVRAQISLEQLVPRVGAACHLHQAMHGFQDIRNPWPEESYYRHLKVLDLIPGLEPALLDALRSIPEWTGDPITRFHIFVDGSSFSKLPQCPAAWAFCVLAECSPSVSFAGQESLERHTLHQFWALVTSRLSMSSEPEQFAISVGEIQSDSLTAEAVGMIWVLAWICQLPDQSIPIEVHFDCMTVGEYAAGRTNWIAPWPLDQLRTHIAVLRHYIQEIGFQVAYTHIKAHSQHPWNECVDRTAKAMALGIIMPSMLPAQVRIALKDPAKTCAWMTVAPQEEVPHPSALPAILHHEGPFERTPCDTTWASTPYTEKAPSPVRVSLCLATANVLSLSPGPQRHQAHGLLQMGRIATLQRQFDDAGLHIVGIQEARTLAGHTRHNQQFLVYQSGATPEGVRGCEVWVSRTRPYGQINGRPLFFSPDHVLVTSFDDRHILAILKAPGLHVRILVLHAPHHKATDADFAAWWDSMTQLADNKAPELPLIVLADTNGRLGSITSEAISNHGAETENHVGSSVHWFALRHSLWIPSTHDCHEGPSYTWQSSQGTRSRLDFVMLPLQWKTFKVRSWVSTEVDLIISQEDHFPACVAVEFSSAKVKGLHGAIPRLDPRHMRDSDRQARFLQHVRNMPPIPWAMPVGVHANMLTSWVQTGATEAFRVDKTQPRQRYMSEHTWALVQTRQYLRKFASNVEKMSSVFFKQIWFLAWQRLVRLRKRPFDLFPSYDRVQQQRRDLLSRCRLMLIWALTRRRMMHPWARQASRMDRIETAAQQAQEALDAAHHHNVGKLFRTLRPLMGQTFRKGRQAFQPVPAVRDLDGVFVDSLEAAAERWRDHFGQAEGGIRVTVPQLQQIASLEHPSYPSGAFSFDLQALPTREAIEAYIHRAKKGKCPGPDGLAAEIYKLEPTLFSRILWPLLTKAALRCAEPMSWRGGDICSVPKTGHAAFEADKFRSIMLSNFQAKISHGLLRQRLLPTYQIFRFSTQAGGIPRIGVDHLHLLVQLYAQRARQCHASCAALFIDVAQAFYRACRHLVTDSHPSDSALIHVFAQNNWSPELFTEFLQHVEEPAALELAHTSGFHQAQVRSLFAGTWFRMRQNDATLTSTSTGTRPGDSIADLLFGFIMGRYMKDLQQRLNHHGIRLTVPLQWLPNARFEPDENVHLDIAQAAWVDDQVILMTEETPQKLLDQVPVAAAIVYDCAASYGLSLNLNRNKTSVVLCLRGTDSQALWTQILHSNPDDPGLDFTCQAVAASQRLSIVPDYLYLGSLQDMKGHPACDVRRRFIAIKPALKLLSSGIFRSPHMPCRTRSQLFQALIMSRLTFGAGAWQLMHVATAMQWQSKIMRLYARLVPHLRLEAHVMHLDLLTASAQTFPALVLAKQRAALFDRIVQTDMHELWALLQSQSPHNGWLALLAFDMQRLVEYAPATEVPLSPTTDHAFHWATLSLQQPGYFLKLTKRVQKLSQQYQGLWHDFRLFEHRMQQVQEIAGLSLIAQRAPDRLAGWYICDQCTACFDTFAALCAHKFKRHEQHNVAQFYAVGSTCRACLKCYHDRASLVMHLKYVRTGCLARLMLSYPRLTTEELDDVRAQEQQVRQQHRKRERILHHRRPVMRKPGPLIPWPWERQRGGTRMPEAVEEHSQWLEMTMQAAARQEPDILLSVLHQREYSPHIVQGLFEHLATRHKLPHLDSVAAFLTLHEATNMWAVQAPEAHLDPSQRIHLLRDIRVPRQALCPATGFDTKRWQCLRQQWDTFDVSVQLAIRLQHHHCFRAQWSVNPPPQSQHEPLFIYVFSGRHREGDFSENIKRIMAEHGVKGHVLTLDLAISTRHDVGNEELIHRIVQWCRNGLVRGLLLAPPCETWSQARYLQGPVRPLRNGFQALALSGLTSPEIAQLRVANFLLFTAIRLVYTAIAFSVPFVLEHPREPEDSTRPTVWRLPWFQYAYRHQKVKRHLIRQAFFGSASSKPTHLLVGFMPAFDRSLQKFMRPPNWAQLITLQGRNADGTFKTSLAKEYPERLNAALADSFVSALLLAQRPQDLQPWNPDDLAYFRWLTEDDREQKEQALAPDYHHRKVF